MMNLEPPLPQDLERFVREQIAAGRYGSETDVYRTALLLLAESSLRRKSLPRHHSGNHWPGQVESWQILREPSTTDAFTARRSLRGMLADLGSQLEFDEFREARREIWTTTNGDSWR
jgi:putative addiction module CopG family antidote